MSNTAFTFATGRIVADPEKHGTVTIFRIALNQREKVNGEWTEVARYMRCKEFNEDRAKVLAKGQMVAVGGSLSWDQRPDDKGGGYYPPEISISKIDILQWAGDKPKTEGGGNKGKFKTKAAEEDKEDLPF